MAKDGIHSVKTEVVSPQWPVVPLGKLGSSLSESYSNQDHEVSRKW